MPSGQARPPAADCPRAARPARAAQPRVGPWQRAVTAVDQVLLLQRTIGNAAVVRLLGAAGQAGPPVQRAPGDWLVINRDKVPLRQRRTINSPSITTLSKGTLGFELNDRNDRWVRLRIPQLGHGPTEDAPEVPKFPPGWIRVDEADVEPATTRLEKLRNPQSWPKLPERFSQLQTPLFAPGGPKAEDVAQGALGDCWLLAPMGAIADTTAGKRLIRDMITPLGAGKYRVRFYRHAHGEQFDAETTVVSDVFPADAQNAPRFARPVGQALWPLVIEKAYAAIEGGYFNLDGRSVHDAFAVLAGHFPAGYSLTEADPARRVSQVKEPSALMQLLNQARTEGKPITASTPRIHATEALTFRPAPGIPGTYVAELYRKPLAWRLFLEVTYQRADDNQEITLRAASGHDEVAIDDLLEDDETWFVTFKAEAGERRQRIPARVSFLTDTIEHDYLVGGHAIMVRGVDVEAGSVTLLDQNYPGEPFEISLEEIEAQRITFTIGELSRRI